MSFWWSFSENFAQHISTSYLFCKARLQCRSKRQVTYFFMVNMCQKFQSIYIYIGLNLFICVLLCTYFVLCPHIVPIGEYNSFVVDIKILSSHLENVDDFFQIISFTVFLFVCLPVFIHIFCLLALFLSQWTVYGWHDRCMKQGIMMIYSNLYYIHFTQPHLTFDASDKFK